MDLRPNRNINYKLLDSGDQNVLTKSSKVVRRTVLPDEYFIERIISSKKSDEGVLYLVKWQDFPLHDCTWEPKSHIPDQVFHLYKNPSIHEEVLKTFAATLEEAVYTRLGSRNNKISIVCPTNIYAFVFGTTDSVEANKDTFQNLPLSKNWYAKFNCHGQGLQLDFPVRVQSSVYNRTVFVPSSTGIQKKTIPVERLTMKCATSVCSAANF